MSIRSLCRTAPMQPILSLLPPGSHLISGHISARMRNQGDLLPICVLS